MSNLETEPRERVCTSEPGIAETVQILQPREVPLGGPRAMTVRRTLPQRGRSLIGAWCFVDSYGPDAVGEKRMNVPPHPHTGLQTVSWLFGGEIEHRDSTGAHALVRPGELNLMTAGRGISHSEVSTPETTSLHGAQLWTALPDAHRNTAPFFERFVPPVLHHQGADVRVFLGSLLGHTSTATTFSPLVGAQIDLPPHSEVTVPVDPTFEHGLLVYSGAVTLDGEEVPPHCMGYRPPGADTLLIQSADEPVLALLIGGEPLGEQIVMWWNFIGRNHDEVVAYRQAWQTDVIEGEDVNGRFGAVGGYSGLPLPAPALPTVRLKPRG